MKKIGLFYSFNTTKTAQIGKKIEANFTKSQLDIIDAEIVDEDTFTKYDNLILGCPTWFDGELPKYWDEFVPAIEDLDLKGKKVAIYGNGDQKGYSENFCDAVGVMAKIMENQGATVVGFTSTDGYAFESSQAKRADQFCGLALDFENQANMNKKRVDDWCAQLKKEFN